LIWCWQDQAGGFPDRAAHEPGELVLVLRRGARHPRLPLGKNLLRGTVCLYSCLFLAMLFRLLKTGLRIRINFIRIRIQHFRLNTDPDPDPIRIQGFNDQKLEKNYSWIKNNNIPIPRPP
jgi:hypothetical protein